MIIQYNITCNILSLQAFRSMSRRQQNLEIYKVIVCFFNSWSTMHRRAMLWGLECCKSHIFNPNKLQVLVSTVLSVSEEVSSSRNQVTPSSNYHNKRKRTYIQNPSIDLLLFTNNDLNQVEDLLRRLENAESDWNVVADPAPRWQMRGESWHV